MNKKGIVLIHGGAGSNTNKDSLKRKFMKSLLKYSQKLLNANIDAITIAEKVIIKIENSGLFNAGKGSVRSKDGLIQMDASIMNGKTKKCGTVALISKIKNPIKIARKVMDDTNHIMLGGKDAENFAKKHNLEAVNDDYFNKESKETFDTIGVVVFDKNKNLAVASSTGGIPNKMSGRIGDTPIIGAGVYADNNYCAVACTGIGENFIKNVVAYDVYARMKYQKSSLEKAMEETIKSLPKNSGGIIGIDKNGNIVVKYNSEHMSFGYTIDNKYCFLHD